MQRNIQERGAALIMLIGITATLAILAVTLVMLLANEQGATESARSTKTSLYYAEAGLNSAVSAVKNTNSWLTTPYTDTTSMNTNYGTLSGAPAVTYLVYDNATPVNYSTNWDANGDGKVWVQTTTTYQGRSTRVRVLMDSSTKVSILPKAVLYSDSDISLSGTSDIYAVNPDGTPDTSGAPYTTSVLCGGDFTSNSSTDFAAPADSTHTQSIGLQVNGSVTTPSHNFSPISGGVGLLSDYFDQAHQASLTAEAQTCLNNVSTLFNASGTAISSTLWNTLKSTSKTTYTASSDLVMPSSVNSGNLTLTGPSSGTSTFAFKKLYVTGDLTLTGNVAVTATSIYVGGDFNISGTTTAITDKFGPVYVGGTLNWDGGSGGTDNLQTYSPTTTTLNGTVMASSTVAGPVFATIISLDGNTSGKNGDNSAYDGTGGPYNLVLGQTWVDGDAGTGDVAVNFSSSSSASTVMCPLLATTEKTVSNGLVNVGTLANPMIYYMQCDNDQLYMNTCAWASTGQYYGLMILFEASITISGNSGVSTPNVVGSVLEGTPNATDITLSGTSSVCYNQTVVDNCTSDSVKTTICNTVPGTWQQLGTN